MLVSRVLYPVEVLGIGKRVGIWLCGCNHKCYGCSNPELWTFDESKNISINTLLEMINKIKGENIVNGFTITGGEPFDQAEELNILVMLLLQISSDILIYTGYKLEELKVKNQISIENLLKNIAVLIDGKYIAEQNTNTPLKGSENQQIHILKKIFETEYKEYLKKPNKIQNFNTNEGIISVGIHRPNFVYELGGKIQKYGIEEDN